MYNGYNKIFWGLIIVTFHINLGMLKILPPFVGFILILSGMNYLYRETHIEAFERARIFTFIKIIISILGEIMVVSSIQLTDFFMLNEVSIVFSSVLELIIFYKLFDGAIQHFNNTDSSDLAEETIKRQRVYTVVSVISIIFLNFSSAFNIEYLQVVVVIALLILRIYLIGIIKGFKKYYIE